LASRSNRWITVDNRDYHHLSQVEIAGGKRISRHLSGSAKIHWGKMQMRHRGQLCNALGNTLDAKRSVIASCVRSTGLWKALTYTLPHHKH